jgi:hypothetical protein
MPPDPPNAGSPARFGDLEISLSANTAAKAKRAEFTALLVHAARAHCRRRGSTTLDSTDVESAYAHLIHPGFSNAWLNAGGFLLTLFGGAVASYGINQMTNDPPGADCKLITVTGLIMAGVGEWVRHLKTR